MEKSFGIFLIYCSVWTILPPTFKSPYSGEIERGVTVSDALRKKMNLANDLVAILCCPDTKQPVAIADEGLIEKINGAIERGQLKNCAQKPVTEKLDGGLIRSDKKILYPVREDIPVMLIDEGIPLDQVA